MIPIRNIYWMLSYYFDGIHQDCFRKMETENFSSMYDMLTEILIVYINNQFRKGLTRSYDTETGNLSMPRGHILMSDSMKIMASSKKALACEYDVFTPDCQMNRILKTALTVSLKEDIEQSCRTEIRMILRRLETVRTLPIDRIDWNIRYNRNNASYKVLIAISRLIIEAHVQTKRSGSENMAEFTDELAYHLYEKFLLNYFRREHRELHASAAHVNWDTDNSDLGLLPEMHTDVTLTKGNRCLIIDAKHYDKILTNHYGKNIVSPGNIYQIFAYVINKKSEGRYAEVSGMLLYAGTDESIQPNESHIINGSNISIRTLDLNRDFDEIRKVLDDIAAEL